MGIVGIGVGGRLARKKCNGWRIVAALALCHPSLLHISCSPTRTWGRNKHRDQCWVEKPGGEKNSWRAWPGWTITAGMGWGRDREERAAIVQIVQIVQIVEGKQELGEEGRGGCTMQYNLVESAEERDILLSVGSWHHHLPASKIVNSASGGRSTFLFWRSSFKTRDFAKRGYLRFWNFYPDLASQR